MSRRAIVRAPNPHMPPPVSAATRRDLFGTMGAMLLLSAAEAGSAKAAELDGELLACCAEAVKLEVQSDAIADGLDVFENGIGPAHNPKWIHADQRGVRAYDLRARVADLPARTPEGMQAKARLVIELLEDDGLADSLALSLARDILERA